MRITLLGVALLFGLALVTGQLDVNIEILRVDPLELNFTVSNPSSFPFTFLQWGTPFEGVWDDMFDIRDEYNNKVDYIGMYVRRGDTPIEEEFITMPGRSHISTIVNLGNNYEFLSTGKYVVRLNLPLYSELPFTLSDDHVVSLSLKSIPIRNTVTQPQGYTNCGTTQINQIVSAISGSISGSTRSYNCLNQRTCNALSTTWFGTFSQSNHNFALSVFNSIRNRLNNFDFNGYCNPAGCGNNVYGYVYPTDTTFTVYLCGLFWNVPNERVNTIVHEMSHFRSLGGTNDYAYGKNNCMALARNNPNQATRNADNICYFAESA